MIHPRIIVNVYAPNTGVPQCIRQRLTGMGGGINSDTIVVGDFNTSSAPMDRLSEQRINKETQTLHEKLDQMDLIGIFRTSHPNAEEYILFSSTHGAFFRIDHILGHK